MCTLRPILLSSLLAVALVSGCAAPGNEEGSSAVRQQLAPTGKIRVAISVGPTANTFRAILDPATGRPRGVAVDLANALGAKLGAPVELMTYDNYVDLLEAGRRGAWDVTFLPFDEERAKVMDYGPAYYRFDFTYLVPGGSAIHAQADVDRPGVRIAVAEGSVTARNRQQALKSATLVRFKTLAEIREQVRAGNVDAVAAGRETLESLAAQVPGARVLKGFFHIEGVAVAVAKNRPAALVYVSDFIESAKSTGVVRRAFDSAGFKNAAVAPAVRAPSAAAPRQQAAPVNLGSAINNSLRQAEVSFTADGKTMYFNCQMRPGRSGNDICISRLVGAFEEGRWTTPEIVGPGVISRADTSEVEPLISPDGKTLYFMSVDRPGGVGGADIWYSENVNGVWQAPKNLGPPFNSPYADHCLFFSADGNEAFWTSTRPGGHGGNDIWTSRKVNGVWQPAVNLGPNVNSADSDHHSIPSPDGRSLYVTSGRPGGFGGEDIYVTTRDDTGTWGPVVNLGPLVNSEKDDRCPSFTPDFRIVIFDSERPGGHGSKDLWWVYYDEVKHIR